MLRKKKSGVAYSFHISGETQAMMLAYRQRLVAGELRPGERLGDEIIQGKKLSVGSGQDRNAIVRDAISIMTDEEFISYLINTKKPEYIAAEHGAAGWNDAELSILGAVTTLVPCEKIDAGRWGSHATDGDDHKKKPILLAYVAGIILKEMGNSPDRKATVNTDGSLNKDRYKAELKNRLLPALRAINGKSTNPPGVLLTLPGIGAGVFAGEFTFMDVNGKPLDLLKIRQMIKEKGGPDIFGKDENVAIYQKNREMSDSDPSKNKSTIAQLELEAGNKIKEYLSNPENSRNSGIIAIGDFIGQCVADIVQEEKGNLSNIRGIYFDGMTNDHPPQKHDGITVKLMRRDNARPQLSDPEVFGDEFKGCEMASLVAADHCSWPGNDFLNNSRNTDEGAKSAATTALGVIAGEKGRYTNVSGQWGYRPKGDVAMPSGKGKVAKNWSNVINEKKLKLQVEGNLVVHSYNRGLGAGFAATASSSASAAAAAASSSSVLSSTSSSSSSSNINAVINEYGGTALSTAVVAGNEAEVKRLLAYSDIKVNMQDNRGNTALGWAIAKAKPEIAILLIRANADIGVVDPHSRKQLATLITEAANANMPGWKEVKKAMDLKQATVESVAQLRSPESERPTSTRERAKALRPSAGAAASGMFGNSTGWKAAQPQQDPEQSPPSPRIKK